MQHHFIHVSGLIAQADLPRWARQGLTSGLLRWAEPQDALKSLSSEEAPAELWWFYSPPWSALGRVQALAGQSEHSAAPWATVHRQLLRARQTVATPVRLLSALHAPPVSLVTEALQPFTGMESLPSGSIEELLSTLEAELIQPGAPHDDMGALLAQLHAWAAPEVWDVLEALEAADWDSSHTPLMREDVSPPEPGAVAHLARLLAAGERAPVVEMAVREAEASLRAAHEQAAVAAESAALALAAAKAEAEAARAEHQAAQEATQGQLKEAKEEGELLLLQLHQVQEELEQLFLQAKDKDAAHQKAQTDAEAAAKAAAEQSAKALAAAQAEAKAALDKSQADAKAALDKATTAHQQEAAKLKEDAAAKAAEHDQARKAQADTQATLDKARAEHQAALEKAQADAKAQLEKSQADAKAGFETARAEHKAAADKAQADMQAALQKAKAEHQAALDHTQGQLKEAQEEGELLLLQLHQVQEELEQIFLQGKDKEAAHAREMAAARAQSAEQVATAETAVEKIRQEAQEAQQKSDSELNRLRNDAQHELTAAKEESELLTMRLRQLQDELEQARAQQLEAESAAADALANAQAAAEQARSNAETAQLQAQHGLEKLQAELMSAEQARNTLTEERELALAAAEAERAQLAEQLGAAELLLEKAREEAQAAVLQAQAASEDAARQAQAAAEDGARQLQDAQSAEELLLLQLQQAQDSLDARSLDLQQLQDQLDAQALEQSRKLQAMQGELQEAQLALELAQADRLQIEQARNALTEERDLALAAAEAERAQLAEQLGAAEAERAQLADQLVAAELLLEKAREASSAAVLQAQAQAQLQAADQIAALEIALERARIEAQAATSRPSADAGPLMNQLQDAQRTEELLLLQLKQLQEDLDARAVRAQELEAQLLATSERYRRLQSRYPQAVDVDSVAIAAVDRHAPVPAIAWRLQGLCVGGTVWPELVLRTTLELGGAGVRLETAAGAVPLAGMDAPLVPKALVARQPGQLERFRGMGQQAWQLLVGACAAVDQALAAASGAVPGAPAGFDLAYWRQSLGALAPALNALPPVFRHDGVRLRSERRASRYEHLWLEFEGAGYGSARLPGFSLRLAAVTGEGGAFSHLPQIEVPATPAGAPPFAGWFAVSRDDYGPNLELRADTQRQAFDLATWRRLPKDAQAMLLSAIATLPAALKALQSSGRAVSRPWLDWAQLLDGLISAMRISLNAVGAQAVGNTPPPTLPPAPVPAQAVLQGAALNPDLQVTSKPWPVPEKLAAAEKSPPTSGPPIKKRPAGSPATAVVKPAARTHPDKAAKAPAVTATKASVTAPKANRASAKSTKTGVSPSAAAQKKAAAGKKTAARS